MEPAQLQLILNVVGITTVATFTSMCFLLRREKRKLAEKGYSENPGPIVPLPVARVSQQDVRELAQARRTEWVQGLSSAISFAKGIKADVSRAA